MIKNFKELQWNEKVQLLEYVNDKEEASYTLSQLEQMYANGLFGDGEGVFISITNGEITGKAQLVLREAKMTGCCYLTKSVFDSVEVAREMIAISHQVAEEYGATHVYLGTNREDVRRILSQLGMEMEYESVIMVLSPHHSIGRTLDVEYVFQDNSKVFHDMYNRIFADIPNGGTMTMEEVNALWEQNDCDHYLVRYENDYIGVLITEVEDHIGFFDIGLLKQYRGRGLGTALIDTAISCLKEKGAELISIVVITKNDHAYQLYERKGFVKETTLNYWCEVKKAILV